MYRLAGVGPAVYWPAMRKLYQVAGAIITPLAMVAIVMIENDPDDAISHLSKWYSLASRLAGHVSEPPSWLAAPFADTVGLLLAASAFFVGIAMAFWPYLPHRFRSRQVSLLSPSKPSRDAPGISRVPTVGDLEGAEKVLRVGSDSNATQPHPRQDAADSSDPAPVPSLTSARPSFLIGPAEIRAKEQIGRFVLNSFKPTVDTQTEAFEAALKKIYEIVSDVELARLKEAEFRHKWQLNNELVNAVSYAVRFKDSSLEQLIECLACGMQIYQSNVILLTTMAKFIGSRLGSRPAYFHRSGPEAVQVCKQAEDVCKELGHYAKAHRAFFQAWNEFRNQMGSHLVSRFAFLDLSGDLWRMASFSE